MSYDPERTHTLIRQTDAAGAKATLAEVERANQLSAASGEIHRLRKVFLEVKSAMIAAGWNDDPVFRQVKEEALK